MRLDPNRVMLAILILAILGVGISLAFIVAAWGFLQRAVISTQPSAAVTVELDKHPEDEPHCPGEYIPYDVFIDPLRYPLAVRVAVTIWDRDEKETVVAQAYGEERVVIYTSDELVRTSDRFYLPLRNRRGEPIEPGRYELRFAAVVEGASPAVGMLRFAVPDGCPS